ncbi:hypothetical protein [Streptomyces sp. NPDC058466]|uniref:DUF6197 family protein n=1 Tax=Streptomyces sp. NPDC058466 TaxID=3346512 RepID=UPI00364BF373
MTTHAPLTASPPPDIATPVELDLDARMALTLAEMDERCRLAILAIDINSAHITIETSPEITAPLPLTPTTAPKPYATPIADLLHRARNRLLADGWCRDAVFDDDGAICPIRAIRLEAAGNRRRADDACVLLLEAIQSDFRDAETIPSWNAAQTEAGPAPLYLDRAAQLAHARNI